MSAAAEAEGGFAWAEPVLASTPGGKRVATFREGVQKSRGGAAIPTGDALDLVTSPHLLWTVQTALLGAFNTLAGPTREKHGGHRWWLYLPRPQGRQPQREPSRLVLPGSPDDVLSQRVRDRLVLS